MLTASIKTVVAGAMALVSCVILLQMGIAYANLDAVCQNVDTMHGDLLPGMGAANAMNASLAQLRAAEAEYIAAPDAGRRTAAATSAKAAGDVWAENYSLYLGMIDPAHQQEHDAFVAIGDGFNGYRTSESAAFALADKGDVTGAFALFSGTMSDAYETTKTRVAEMVATNAEDADNVYADNRTTFGRALTHTFGLGALAVLLLAATACTITWRLTRPMSVLISAMNALAHGATGTVIAYLARADEIGDMARALNIFKDNVADRLRISADAERQRTAGEAARHRNEEERVAAEETDQAVRALGDALSRLARGELDYTIDRPFAPALDALRHDFNGSAAGLGETLQLIGASSMTIQGNSRQMSVAADDLSKRTERQAALLEETVTAADQITVTVKAASTLATDTSRIVGQAKRSADDSAAVVNSAIQAMDRIRVSSEKISQIIGVIDGIAFQTNLLALNAGVEVARAGGSGKGFAVVAQEVRELAQRSAQAAREIGGLIGQSALEVSTGAACVQKTGDVLLGISDQIVGIADHVERIARSTQQQAGSLQEVNASVTQMDQMTQRNAGMAEETSAATRALSDEADRLMELVSRFRLEGPAGHRTAARRAA